MTPPERVVPQDLLEALGEADALDTFTRLPQADQDSFSRWVAKARDNESHWRRIEALVLAMRIGPLGPDPAVEAPYRSEVVD
jgi:uncharacterized protein YdeI (YjbR/CyaY-like superfamily)